MQDIPVVETAMAKLGAAEPVVQHFRHIVLWPLQLLPDDKYDGELSCGDELLRAAPDLWAEHEDEFGTAAGEFQERHYREFVSFLPHVQRFLYGDAPGPVRNLGYGAAPLRSYRRKDVTHVRLTLRAGTAPITLKVPHIDVCTFYDVDALVMACELQAENLPLSVAQEIIYRFGRAYPSGWTETGEPLHCAEKVEWLDRNGNVLSTSDYNDRQKYQDLTGWRRAPRIAQHWQFILSPLAPYASDRKANLRFRQIEYYRMPAMSYLVVEDMSQLTDADYQRLALGTAPGERNTQPYAEGFPQDFTKRYCYDRHYSKTPREGVPRQRYLSGGHAFTMIVERAGHGSNDNERGALGQFRHQYFLLFLIAHFHKAALLMLSDRLVAATKHLQPAKFREINTFRRETYRLQEAFMRFTHRYWFTEISDQPQTRDLFALTRGHLGTATLYNEVRGEIFDMVTYLDSDLLRRQTGSMHRLTVVTVLGLIGTTVTGFLGMNLIAAADAPLATKVWYFGIVTAVVSLLTLATIIVSRWISNMFDKMSGDGR